MMNDEEILDLNFNYNERLNDIVNFADKELGLKVNKLQLTALEEPRSIGTTTIRLIEMVHDIVNSEEKKDIIFACNNLNHIKECKEILLDKCKKFITKSTNKRIEFNNGTIVNFVVVNNSKLKNKIQELITRNLLPSLRGIVNMDEKLDVYSDLNLKF